MLSSFAPARRRLVLGVLAVVTVGLVAAAVALAVAAVSSDDSAAPVPQGRAGPVLLVPGYGGGTDALDALAVVLRAHGRFAAVFGLPGDGRGDLDEQAGALASAARTLRSEQNASTIDVIGYSAGGVVARLLVRDHGGASFVRRVVTLGSPHHGTDVAGAAGALVPDACPEACQQLVPDSDLLRSLDSGDETPSGPTYVSVWTSVDKVVVPPDSARLDGAVNLAVQDVCPATAVGHGDLPRDPVVQSIVLAELRPGPPPELTSCPAGVSS